MLSATLDAARDSFDARRVSWHWEDDGSFSFRGRLTADEGALLVQAIAAARLTAPAYADEHHHITHWARGGEIAPSRPVIRSTIRSRSRG